MKNSLPSDTLAGEVRRLLEEYDVRSLDLLEDWNGETLSDLEHVLSAEEYQMLLDNLQTAED